MHTHNNVPILSKRKAVSMEYTRPSGIVDDTFSPWSHVTDVPFKRISLVKKKTHKRTRTDRDANGIVDLTTPCKANSSPRANSLPRDNASSKTKRNVTKEVKRIIWQRHFGHAKQGTCPVCGETQLHRDHNSGFEAAHIVPHAYCKHQTQNLRGPDLAVYLVPSCATCNNSMGTRQLLDYMYMYGRACLMCKLMWDWFQGYTREEPLRRCGHVLWGLVDYLFGPSRYPDKGSMTFQSDIYRTLARHQLVKISKDIRTHREKMDQLLQLADQVDQYIND